MIDEMLYIIKKHRSKNNISQQKIADSIGVPRSRYQKWEENIAKPKYDDAILIENPKRIFYYINSFYIAFKNDNINPPPTSKRHESAFFY